MKFFHFLQVLCNMYKVAICRNLRFVYCEIKKDVTERKPEMFKYNLTNPIKPFRRLLALCSVVKASPTESEELVFITSLVTHLKRCPDLLTLFAHRPNPGLVILLL